MPAKKKAKSEKKTKATEAKKPIQKNKQQITPEELLTKLEHELPAQTESQSDAVEQPPKPVEPELPTIEPSQPPVAIEPPNVIIPPGLEQVEPANPVEPAKSEASAQEEFVPPDRIPPPSNSKDIVILWILLILLLGGISTLIFLFFSRSQLTIEYKLLTGGPAKIPSPTKTLKINLSQFKVKILNGSGIPGEAAKAKTLLEEAGFSIESTGNADKYDYKESLIQSKKAVPEEFSKKLIRALNSLYAATIGATLEESEKVDAIVIVGSKKR